MVASQSDKCSTAFTKSEPNSGLVIHHFDQIHKGSVDKIPKDTELVTDSDVCT